MKSFFLLSAYGFAIIAAAFNLLGLAWEFQAFVAIMLMLMGNHL